MKMPPAGAGGSLFGGTAAPKPPKQPTGLPHVGFGGKGSRQQNHGPGSPATITGGSPLSRSMGQYGKGHSYLAPGMDDGVVTDPTAHPGMSQVRDSSGGIRRNPRQGGLGPNDDSNQGTDI
jgi:hypothetical protein